MVETVACKFDEHEQESFTSYQDLYWAGHWLKKYLFFLL